MEDHDIAAVATPSGEPGYPMTPEETAANLRQIHRVTEVQPSEILVAATVENDAVVGWIHVCVPADLVKANVTEIWGLVVASAHRGQGCGRALMEAARRWALDHRCEEIRFRSGSHRAEAHAFHERLGYRIVKTQMVFSRSLASD